MTETNLRERKKQKAQKNDEKPEKEKEKLQKPEKGRSIFKRFLIAVLLTGAISYVLTGSFLFGYQLPTIDKMKRILDKEIVLTQKELAKYDGSDPNLPIYIAIEGKIYDVSASPEYYGPGGGYKFFAGRDASRAYITGCFSTHLTHDLRGLSEAQVKSLQTWVQFYKTSPKYSYVGKVLLDAIDPNSEIPVDCISTSDDDEKE